MASITNTEEVWRPMVGHENQYMVSSVGRIARLVKGRVTPNGYRTVHIRQEDKKKHTPVHRLVAKAFIDNPDCKPVVNHLDGDKLNNAVENLEWCTLSENTKHSFATGLQEVLKGENHWNAKLTDEQVREIRKSPLGLVLAGRKYGIQPSGIAMIRRGERWRHVV